MTRSVAETIGIANAVHAQPRHIIQALHAGEIYMQYYSMVTSDTEHSNKELNIKSDLLSKDKSCRTQTCTTSTLNNILLGLQSLSTDLRVETECHY